MRLLFAVFGLLLVPSIAAAQPPAAPAPSNPLTIPAPPEVTDPMLAPVPPPKRVLSSWDEALGLLRARSTDLRLALDAVRQAEAATRIALAQYLPTINGARSFNHHLITRNSFAIASGRIVSSTAPPQDVWNGSLQAQQALV